MYKYAMLLCNIWTQTMMLSTRMWRAGNVLTGLLYVYIAQLVDLPKGFISRDEIQGATPAIDTEAFREEQAKLRKRLQQLNVHKMHEHNAP